LVNTSDPSQDVRMATSVPNVQVDISLQFSPILLNSGLGMFTALGYSVNEWPWQTGIT
ncbi:hypothetical protein HK100_008337, partial [Physocladia obscura]